MLEFTIRQALTKANSALQAVVEEPHLESEVLLSYVLNKDRSYLYTWPERPLPNKDANFFLECLHRRLKQEPLAYITGVQEFWSLPFHVNSHVLVPRADTEILVETVLNVFKERTQIKIADLGTGCGAIGVALAHEQAQWDIYATDISQPALKIAQYNAEKLSCKNIYFYQGNWCQALPAESFDAIVSNPPYISEDEWPHYAGNLKFEPKSALLAEKEGLAAYVSILQGAKGYLKPGGYIFFEHGYAQAAALNQLLVKFGFTPNAPVLDLAGHARVSIGRYDQ